MTITLNDYAGADATTLVRWVQSGEVEPERLVELCRQALESTRELGVLVAETPEETRRGLNEGARGAPLWGVPFLLKDLGAYMANVPQEFGSRLARGCRFDHDAELVRRYRRAGLLFVGRTKTPEFGLMPTTEPREGGPVRNPWDIGRSSGGSSGGSAAAVAAGIVPVAHGTDAAGSLRIPAHCCGTFALKPGRGRMPRGPMGWGSVVDYSVQHVLSRSVRDSALLLDATAGPELGSSYVASAAPGRYVDLAAMRPPPLRIAVTSAHPGGKLDSECDEALRAFAKTLAEHGHRVEEASPAIDWELLRKTVLVLVASAQSESVAKIERYLERQAGPDDLEPFTWACIRHGQSITARQLCGAVDFVHALTFALAQFFSKYDLWLAPTCRTVAPPLGAFTPSSGAAAVEDGLERIFRFTAHPLVFNLTGQPAATVPYRATGASLPVGAHLAARHGEEHLLLQVAAQLEQTHPWIGWAPPHGVKRT